ncbi:LysE family translocator [Roseomonas alkaliterrae]|uniref:Threonine/homoserine/homoserine lactone efflux protein n=1 Tax=Neoroseomonas alkaliterrae TaxID=1452450 RepID=A0A840XS45_9PROT|nr:threonine/homoserine/homoserine lactone efflux protein [Neoroseomonas alkaliterrae]MBR0675749.1 LysE family translocator [Neoroseomonas alkaliterrae]
MALDTWLAFLAATAVMLAIPGPTILLVIGQSLGAGRRAALPLVAGVALGDLTAMTLSLAGLGALLAASATLFTVLKFAGAAYLVWLGLRLWRAPVEAGALPPLSARRAFRDAYVVTALNPKSVAFFVAFVPLFLDPARPFPAQAAVLVASFVTLAAANAAIYALLAARLSGAVRRPGVRRAFNRGGGALLMGAGAATAAMRQGG